MQKYINTYVVPSVRNIAYTADFNYDTIKNSVVGPPTLPSHYPIPRTQ
jgi:hypothetical protein